MRETTVTDGRTGRSQRTRNAVVDALLALIEGGNLRPTAREVADAAGVSLRSVYVHFADVESLFLAASVRHYEDLQELIAPWEAGVSLDERVDEFVARRGRIHARSARLRRAAVLQEPFSPALQQVLDYWRRAARRELEAVFAPELAAQPEAERPRLRVALEVASSATSWDNLVEYGELSEDGAAGVVRDMLGAILRAWAERAPAQAREHPRSLPVGTVPGLGAGPEWASAPAGLPVAVPGEQAGEPGQARAGTAEAGEGPAPAATAREAASSHTGGRGEGHAAGGTVAGDRAAPRGNGESPPTTAGPG